jgi:hypothetical protein
MLRKLSNEIAECYQHAERCRRKAHEATIETARQEYLEMERRWLFLARSYEFTERLTEFSQYAKSRKLD